MHKLISRIFATSLSLFITSYLVAGFKIDHTWQAILTAGLVFVIFNTLIAPLIKLLLLPINLLTLGVFRWLTNVLLLYLFDIFYKGINISAYNFSGFKNNLIALQPRHITLFWTLVISSFVISFTYSIISSLIKTD